MECIASEEIDVGVIVGVIVEEDWPDGLLSWFSLAFSVVASVGTFVVFDD